MPSKAAILHSAGLSRSCCDFLRERRNTAGGLQDDGRSLRALKLKFACLSFLATGWKALHGMRTCFADLWNWTVVSVQLFSAVHASLQPPLQLQSSTLPISLAIRLARAKNMENPTNVSSPAKV